LASDGDFFVNNSELEILPKWQQSAALQSTELEAGFIVAFAKSKPEGKMGKRLRHLPAAIEANLPNDQVKENGSTVAYLQKMQGRALGEERKCNEIVALRRFRSNESSLSMAFFGLVQVKVTRLAQRAALHHEAADASRSP
jgi:hypothetical protein